MEKWVANCYIKMRTNGIRWIDVANKIGWNKSYLSMVINGKENPAEAERKVTSAVVKITPKKIKELPSAVLTNANIGVMTSEDSESEGNSSISDTTTLSSESQDFSEKRDRYEAKQAEIVSEYKKNEKVEVIDTQGVWVKTSLGWCNNNNGYFFQKA